METRNDTNSNDLEHILFDNMQPVTKQQVLERQKAT